VILYCARFAAALCIGAQVATMNIGLEDTLAYYSPEEFAAGFKKTMAFQPRVIKQNRGSSGEGIWIIKLKEECLGWLSTRVGCLAKGQYMTQWYNVITLSQRASLPV